MVTLEPLLSETEEQKLSLSFVTSLAVACSKSKLILKVCRLIGQICLDFQQNRILLNVDCGVKTQDSGVVCRPVWWGCLLPTL